MTEGQEKINLFFSKPDQSLGLAVVLSIATMCYEFKSYVMQIYTKSIST